MSTTKPPEDPRARGGVVTDTYPDEDVCVGMPDQARAIFSRWARIRAAEGFEPHFACDRSNPEAFWNQIAADIEHSDLLHRILRGEEPR